MIVMKSLRIATSRTLLVVMAFVLTFGLIGPMLTSPALASSSRAATVVDVTGTAYLKKAGGSKPYRVYKKMTVNQNDTIITEKGASVTLNIVDQDDEVIIAENSEVYVADLMSQSGGTKTSLYLSSGSAYSNVNSKGSSDTYRIETPNATMGVRGTHFIVAYNKQTGLPILLVVSGYVETSPSNVEEGDIVYPGYQASVLMGPAGQDIVITPEFWQDYYSPVHIETMLKFRDEILKEQQDFINAITSHDEVIKRPQDIEDLNAYWENVQNLVYQYAQKLLESADLDMETKERFQLELPSEFPERNDKAYSEEALQRREEARQKQEQAAAEREKKRQEITENKRELVDLAQQRKEKLDEANRQAEEEAERRAVERYMSNLSEEEREAFLRNQEEAKRGGSSEETDSTGSPSDTGSNPGSPGDQPGDEQPKDPAEVSLVLRERDGEWMTVDLVMENFPEGFQGAQFSIVFDAEQLNLNVSLAEWKYMIAEAVGQVFANAELNVSAETGVYLDNDAELDPATELLISILSLGDVTNNPVEQTVLLSIPLIFTSSDPANGSILLKGVMFVGQDGQEVSYPIEVKSLTY